MACNWRIRHKLMLGMGLVVALMALLLGGTLKGLSSYRVTMRTIDRKLEELKVAGHIKEAIHALTAPAGEKEAGSALSLLYDRRKDVRDAIARYEEKLNEVEPQQTPDVDYGFKEKEQLAAFGLLFARLDAAVADAMKPSLVPPGTDAASLPKGVKDVTDALVGCANDLTLIIHDGLRERIDASRAEYRTTCVLLVTTCVFAVLTIAGILRFFYRWVAAPIRDLSDGVGRIARGDFEHRLDVNSGDEMEDLARAFNSMTDRLREMYTNLAQQVNDRSRQLVRSERLAGVGFLAAGVAHEINNPLASIAFCSEALERRLADLFAQAPGDPHEQETVTKYLKMIQEEAFRCKEITQRLLSLSRGGDRKRAETDLAEVLRGVLDLVQPLPNSKGKTLVFEPAGPLPAWVNGQEVKQVFLNLVVNALDSMDEGGQLTISAAGDRDGMVALTFRDTGCGMTPDVLENLFEPFFTRSRTGKGTGLGLSISHRIITQHGGEITATSDGPNRGSTFIVRLPTQGVADGGEEEVLDPEEEFLKLSSAQRRAA